ncbi:MAG: type II secretion system F family protein [Phycisphaerales bacterium JB063]
MIPEDITFNPGLRALYSLLTAAAFYMAVRHGYGPVRRWLHAQELTYDRVLRRQLLMDVSPRSVVWLNLSTIAVSFVLGFLVSQSLLLATVLAGIVVFIPHVVIKHMETKRRQKLEFQLVDGLTTLASGVRAGLNLVQAMKLLVDNLKGPIQQEFGQILREYEMGMDLNQAMRIASNRIGSPLYRLTFTAIEMHRVRGGDSGDSMDRIADAIRDIQRLEGKLDAITAQGRAQANFMAIMPIAIIIILFLILPEQTSLLFTHPYGRLMLVAVGVMIATGYVWIRNIMRVDI